MIRTGVAFVGLVVAESRDEAEVVVERIRGPTKVSVTFDVRLPKGSLPSYGGEGLEQLLRL